LRERIVVRGHFGNIPDFTLTHSLRSVQTLASPFSENLQGEPIEGEVFRLSPPQGLFHRLDIRRKLQYFRGFL
jgi:hypothetical protein